MIQKMMIIIFSCFYASLKKHFEFFRSINIFNEINIDTNAITAH